MPCEGCNVQFTVFKRKRPCSECRRYFCNHCLTKHNQNILCERCVIFTRRPLTRADLLNLKPKDLIFYLQSKHISTTGCVEKEELVNLILANTNSGVMPSNGRSSNSHNTWTTSSSSSSSSNSVTVDGNGGGTTTATTTTTTAATNNATENCTNTFDQLKQTCQNFFNSFTDRISNDLGFDTIRNNTTTTTSPTSNTNYNNYCDNDGIITREIPTYAESINRSNRNGSVGGGGGRRNIIRPTNFVPNTTTTTTTTAPTSNTNVNLNSHSPIVNNDIFSSASSPSSPINSLSSMSSQSISSQTIHNPNHQSINRNCNNNNNNNNNENSGKTLNNSSAHHQIGKFGQNVSNHRHPIDSQNKKLNKQIIFEIVVSDTNGSGCDCSDDEVITKYTKQQRTNNHNHKTFPSLSSSPLSKDEGNLVDLCSPTSQNDSVFEDQIAGPSGSAAESVSNSKSLANENNETTKSSSNGSSGSSFEELGAVGGNGGVGGGCSGVGGGGGTSSDNENWQMVHKVEIPSYSSFTANQGNSNENNWNRLVEAVPGPSSMSFTNNSTNNGSNKNDPLLLHSNVSNSTEKVIRRNNISNQENNIIKQQQQQQQHKSGRRITRRRSDGCIYRQKNQFEIAGPSVLFQQLDEESDEGEHNERKSHKRVKKSCKKCGKSKKSIEGQVDKFKKQLESSNLSANEIKRELAAFVDYLEQRAKSFDCSDDSSEANHDTNQSNENGDISDKSRRQSRNDNNDEYDDGGDGDADDADDDEDDDDDVIEVPNEIIEIISDDSNDGIHVYAQEDESYHRQQQQQHHQPQSSKHDPRFINLSDFKSSADLDDLSVKQLKEILMLNRVDFKGCCEKQELLDRVKRLWKELQSCPEVEKLPADDLCKICMDAPIECVILECGHMATCTNCGKVLSECPICRQYIVRIVRFFRA